MRPKRYDLVDTIDLDDPTASVLRGIRAGADWPLGIKLYTAPGVVENLTGKAFTFHIRRSVSDSTVLLTASTEDGRITNGGVTGALTILLPKAVTRSLEPGQAYYGLAETTAGGLPRMEGKIDIVKAPVR